MPGNYIDPTTGFSLEQAPAGTPTFSRPEAPKRNWLTAGLASGTQEALGQLGSAVSGLGAVTGVDAVRDAGQQFAEARAKSAIAAGRPDLEEDPWSFSGVGYNLAKMAPMLAGGLAAGLAFPEAAVPLALARVAGGARAGAMAIGAFGTQLPTQIGSNIQQAVKDGHTLTSDDVVKAAGLAVPEAALGSVVPARLGHALEEGAVALGPKFLPDVAKRIFTGAASNAPIGGAQSAITTAMTEAAYGDPNASNGDRARTIVDSFFHGAVAGGVLGGAIGGVAGKRTPKITGDTPTDALKAATDSLVPPELPPDLPPRQDVSTDVRPGPAEGNIQTLLEPPPLEGEARVVGRGPDEQVAGPGDRPAIVNDPRSAGAVVPFDQLQGLEPDRRPTAGDVVTPPAQEGQAPPKFGDVPEADMRSMFDSIKEKIDNGSATGMERAIHAQIGTEIAARSQPGLPDAPLFTPEQMQARAPAVDAFRKTLLSDEDIPARAKKLPLIADSKATSDAEMVNSVRAAIEAADQTENGASKTLLKVADRFGVTDATGSPRDLNAEMSSAMDKAREIYNAKGREALVQFKAETIDPLQKLIDAHAEADKLRAAEPPPATAIPDPSAVNTEGEGSPTAARATPDTVPEEAVQTHADLTAALDGKDITTDDGQVLVQRRDDALAKLESGDDRGARQTLAQIKREAAGLPDRRVANDPLAARPGPTRETITARPLADNIGDRLFERFRSRQYEDRALLDRARGEPGDDIRAQPGALDQGGERLPGMERTNQRSADYVGDQPSRKEAAERVAKVTLDRETADARLTTLSKDENTPELFRNRATQALAERDPVIRQNMLKAIDAVMARPTVARNAREDAAIKADPTHPLNGDVVKVGDRISLVRKVGYDGRPTYTVFDKETGDYGSDMRAQSAAVRNAIKSEELRDRSMALAHPQGPFEGRLDNVVTTDSVSPAIREAATTMMRLLGLGDLKLFIAQGSDLSGNGARDRYNLFGKYSSILGAAEGGHAGTVENFGPKSEHFAIHLGDGKTPGVAMEDLWHEVGHIHELISRGTASRETKAALDAEYVKYLQKTEGLSKQDVIKRLRNRETARDSVQNLGDDPVRMTAEDDKYLRSYQEWHADQVSKAMSQLGKEEPTTLVGKFFAKIADGWRKLVSMVTGEDYMPTQAILDAIAEAKPGDAQSWLRQRRADEAGWSAYRRTEGEGPRDIAQQDDLAMRTVSSADKVKDALVSVVDRIPVGEAGTRLRSSINGFMSRSGILDRVAPSLGEDNSNMVRAAVALRSFAKTRYELLGTAAFKATQGIDDKNTTRLNKLMASATMNGLDPRIDLDKHTWMQSLSADLYKDRATEHARLQQEFKSLAQATGGKSTEAFNAFHDANQTLAYSRLAETTHQFIDTFLKAELPQYAATSPVEQYSSRHDLHTKPAEAAAFMREGVQGQYDALVALEQTLSQARKDVGINESPVGDEGQVRTINESNDAKNEARAKVDETLKPLSGLVRSMKSEMGRLSEAPNFALGRGTSNHFIKASFPKDANGRADAASVQAMQKMLDAEKLGHIGLNPVSGNPDIFIKADTLDQRERIYNLMLKGQKEGWLDQSEKIVRGEPREVNKVRSVLPDYIKQTLDAVDKRGTFEPQENASPAERAALKTAENEFKSQMTRMYLDSLSDNSTTSTQTARAMVQGFNTDMIGSFGDRLSTSANAIAQIASSPKEAAAVDNMRQKLLGLMGDENTDAGTLARATEGLKELQLRTGIRQWSKPSSIVDGLKGVNYAYYLSASPAHVLQNLAAQPMLLWPELAKKHGFAASAKAIGNSTTRSFNVMRAIFDGDQRVEGAITHDALTNWKNGTIATKDIDTLMQAAADGVVDLGGISRQFADTVSGNAEFGKTASGTVKWAAQRAAMTSVYSEQVIRVQAVLAAADLYDAKPVKRADGSVIPREQYIAQTVRKAHMDFSDNNVSRQTGGAGMFGTASPLVFAFQQFQQQLMEKLYSEVNVVLGRHEGNRVESGKWLLAHAAATTALAGSMGLPLVAPLAGAGNKLANLVTGKDDWDFEASYRNFLTDTFGADVGEALAKGAPRALGVDLSSLGSQNLLPFTKLLTSRANLEDTVKDWGSEAAGAPFSMSVNMLSGASDWMQGDWLRGAGKLMPVALKGPTDALRMSLYGYQNAKNQDLPMQPSTADIVLRAMGIHSADKALYNEKSELLEGLSQARKDRASRIMTHLTTAIERNDTDAIAKYKVQANEFAQDHPDQQLLPSIGSNVANRKVQTETARTLGDLPLGVRTLDTRLRKQLGFGS